MSSTRSATEVLVVYNAWNHNGKRLSFGEALRSGLPGVNDSESLRKAHIEYMELVFCSHKWKTSQGNINEPDCVSVQILYRLGYL